MKTNRLTRTLFTTFVSLLMILTSFVSNPTLINADPVVNPGATLNKTATPIPGLLNTWEMKLRVEVKPKTETTDVVLVIDRSGSMGELVGTTGKTRMKLAQEAANTFIDTTLVSGVQIGIVSFAANTTTESGFSTDKTALKGKVNALSANGGTWTQDGLKVGHTLLATSTADHKILVILSDGEPTFAYKPSATYPPDTGGNYEAISGIERVLVDDRETLFTAADFNYGGGRIGSGSLSYSRLTGTTGDTRNINFAKTAIAEAGIAKAKNQTIFSIALGAGTIGEYSLKGIASKPEYYFQDAGNTLQAAFAAIALQIKQPMVGNIMVTDPMGPGFSLVPGSVVLSADSTHTIAPTDQINWKINKFQPVTGDSTKMFAEMTYRITTNASIVDNYTNLAQGAAPSFPTNGKTTFVYTPDNANVPLYNYEFVVPKVTPTIVRVDKELRNEMGDIITDDSLDFKFSLTGQAHSQIREGQVKAGGKTYIWNLDKVDQYKLLETEVLNGHLDEFDVTYTKDALLNLTYGSGLHEIGIRNKLKVMSFVPTKTVSDANQNGLAEPGEILNYTITVKNTGERIIRKLKIKDELLTLIPYIDGIAGVTLNVGGSQKLLTDLVAGIEVNIPVGETLTITFSVKVKDDFDVDLVVLLTNIALIGTIPKDANIPTGAPKLEASKKVSDENNNGVAEPGELLNYTITIKNTGKVGAKDVFIQDNLASIIDHIDDVGTTKIMVNGAERNLSELIAGFDLDVGVNQTILITFSVRVKADLDPAITPILANIATVGTLTPGTEIPTGAPKLVSSKTVKDRNNNQFAEAGEFLDYEIKVTNNGNLYKNNVLIKDTLVDLIPHIQNFAGLKYTLGGVEHPIQELIDGFTVNIAAGATVSVKFTVQVKADLDTKVVTKLKNLATVGDDTPEVEIPTGAPKLAIAKKVVDKNDNGYAEAGEELYYEIWVSNNGEVTAKDVVIKDDLALMFAHLGDISGEQYEYNGNFYPLSDLRNGITMNVGVGENNIVKIKFKVTLKDNLNTVTVSKIDNKATANGIPAETTIPTGAPEIYASKLVVDASGDGFAEPGEMLTYTITFGNKGNVGSGDILVQDTLSDLLGHVDLTGVKYDMGDGILRDIQNLITGFTMKLGPNDQRFITFTVKVNDNLNVDLVKTLSNLATIGELTPETEIPTGAPKLVADKSVSDASGDMHAEAGEALTYTITVTNSGNVVKKNLLIQDTLSDLLPHIKDISTVNYTMGNETGPLQKLIDGFTINLGVGETRTLVFTVTVKDVFNTDEVKFLRNLATVGDDTPETEIPTGAPKLSATKKVQDETKDGFAEANEKLTYTITINNTGNVVKKGLFVQDTLSDLLPYIKGIGSIRFTMGTGTRPLQDLIDGFTIDIEKETTVTITFVVEVMDGLDVDRVKILSNLATVGDFTPETEIPTGVAKLTSGKLVGDGNQNSFAEAGETLYYEIWVTNSGNVKKEITIKDDLADLMAYIDSPLESTFTLNGITHPMSELIAGKLVTVDANTTQRIRFSVTVKADMKVKDIEMLRNIAIVGDDTPEAEIPTGEPDLSAIKIAKDDNGDGYAEAGELMNYTIMVTNQGNVSALDITIKDDLAKLKDHIDTLEGVMFEMGGETYPIEQLMNGFEVDIAPMAVIEINFTVRVKKDIDVKVVKILANEAFVNDEPLTTETPTEKLELEVDKEVLDGNADGVVFPNGNLTYSIMIKNNSKSNAYNVLVTDKLNNVLYAINDPSENTLYHVYKGVTKELKVKDLMEGTLVNIEAGESLVLYFEVKLKGNLLEKDLLVNLVEVDNLTATATIPLEIPLVEPEKIPKPAVPIKVKPSLPATGLSNKMVQNGIQMIAIGLVLMSIEAFRRKRQKAE